jgi:hypothetical protein
VAVAEGWARAVDITARGVHDLRTLSPHCVLAATAEFTTTTSNQVEGERFATRDFFCSLLELATSIALR